MSTSTHRRWRRLAAGAVGVLLALALIEVGLRVARGHDPAQVRAGWERLAAGEQQYNPTFRGILPALAEGELPASGDNQLRLLHPFVGWETAQGMEQVAELVRAQSAAPGDPRPFRVMITGGSVAAIFGRVGGPALAAQIEADPRLAGRKVELWPFGRAAFKQPQQLMLVAWLMTLGLQPDVVLELDGHNEVATASDNAVRGTHPAYPSIPYWGGLALVGALDRDVIRTASRALELHEEVAARARTALDQRRDRSALVSWFTESRLKALNREQGRLYEAFFAALDRSASSGVLKGPPFDTDPQHVPRQAVAVWERSSGELHALCTASGVRYVHALQPALHDPAGKTPTESELATAKVSEAWMRGVTLGYPLMREAGARLSAAGVRFVDLTGVFRGLDGDIYYDSCHFGERGNLIVADRLARAILEAL
jgi:hypothetical protein